jgi:hypothetical protein
MRAEAKDYYEKNGVYQLTSEDWAVIEKQQADYIDDENIYIDQVKQFIGEVCNNIKLKNKKYYVEAQGNYLITWTLYSDWYTGKSTLNKPMSGAMFWKNIRALGQKTGIVKPLVGRIRIGAATNMQAAAVYVKQYDKVVGSTPTTKDKYEEVLDEDEIPDMEY